MSDEPISTTETPVDALTAQLREENAALQLKLDAALAGIEAVKAARDTFEKGFETQTRQHGEARKSVEKLKVQIDTSGANIQELKAQVLKVQDELKSADEKIFTQFQENEKLKQQLETARLEVLNLTEPPSPQPAPTNG